MNAPKLPIEEYNKLKAIYDAAPANRYLVNSLLGEGNDFRELDLDKEASKLEGYLEGTDFAGGTFTEGIVFEKGGKTIVRCEIVLQDDYYMELETDAAFSFVEIKGYSEKSPW